MTDAWKPVTTDSPFQDIVAAVKSTYESPTHPDTTAFEFVEMVRLGDVPTDPALVLVKYTRSGPLSMVRQYCTRLEVDGTDVVPGIVAKFGVTLASSVWTRYLAHFKSPPPEGLPMARARGIDALGLAQDTPVRAERYAVWRLAEGTACFVLAC